VSLLFRWILLASFLLSGCAGAFPAPGGSLPGWVMSPPADTSRDFFGVGEGTSLARAKASALNDIAGKLGTEVSSNVGRDVRQNGEQIQRMAHEVITARVDKTRLLHHRVLKSTQRGGRYYALLSVSREAMKRDALLRLKQLDQYLAQQWQALPGLSALQQFVRAQKMAERSKQAIGLVMILQALDRHFQVRPYFEKDNLYQKKRDALLSSTLFRIHSSRGMHALAQGLVARLSRDHIQSALGSRGRSADPVIEVRAELEKRVAFSTSYVRLLAALIVKDAEGHIVSSLKYEARGESIENFGAATQNAVEGLLKQWQRKPALEIIGLGI